MTYNVAIIPARGGSKRLKGKNIYNVWGKPMIAWVIQATLACPHINAVWVSSDDTNILSVAESHGARTLLRGPELSNDTVFKQEVIRDAVKRITEMDNVKIDNVFSIQANSPEISTDILTNAYQKFIMYDRNELISTNFNGIQNAALRIMKYNTVFQRDLSTKCGFYMCNLIDVHTEHDVLRLGTTYGERLRNANLGERYEQ